MRIHGLHPGLGMNYFRGHLARLNSINQGVGGRSAAAKPSFEGELHGEDQGKDTGR